MAAEGPRGSELAQLVPHHRLGDEHRDVPAAVVHGYGVAKHGRHDHGPPGPRLDNGLAALFVLHVHLLHQVVVDEGPLLQATRHCRLAPYGLPHGLTGWRPPELLPSPPPSGWSMGFMATPRTDGRLPFQRLRPALPSLMLPCSALPTSPTVARHSTLTRRISPDGMRSCA